MRMTFTRAMRAVLAGTLSVAAAVSTGCGIGVLQQGGGDAVTQTGELQGKVMGGEQPIGYSHLYLFSAGTAGYGSASTALITLPDGTDATGPYILSDQYGYFTLTGRYACIPGTAVYVYSSGGNTGAGNNASVGLAGALGLCPATGTFFGDLPFVVVNEQTTVAFVNALNAYIVDARHVGAPNTTQAQLGLTNAVTLANALVSPSSGTAFTANAANNALYPYQMIGTVANVLAACVNSQGTSFPVCNTLLSTATSDGTSTGTAASDTFVAALNIAHHPAANVTTLYGLQSATPPFSSYASAPNDFALMLQTGAGYMPNGNGYSVALDSQGDGWVTTGSAGLLTKLNAEGNALTAVNGVYGTTDAVDLSDNVWLDEYAQDYLAEVSSTGVKQDLSQFRYYISSGNGIAIDAASNIWVADNGNNVFVKITPGATTYGACCYSGSGSGYVSNVSSVAIDFNGDAWGTSGNAQVGGVGPLYESSATLKLVSPVVGYGNPAFNTAMGASIDANGRVWFASNGTNTIGGFTPTNSTYIVGSGGGLNAPAATAVDGLGNIWVTDNTAYLKEFSNAGVALTGAKGLSGGRAVYVNGSIGIDPSGDVWTNSGSLVKVYIGVAAPAVTPIAAAVANKTLGTRP